MFEPLKLKDGTEVEIEVDDIFYIATAREVNGRTIGTIEFRHIEDPSGDYLKITHAFLDKLGGRFVRQGIGSACVQRMKEATGLLICAAPHDGIKQDDGSHLTGDAPAFVESLLSKGDIFEC